MALAGNDPRTWSPFNLFNAEQGVVLRQPPGTGAGYWVGAPGIAFDPTDNAFYLCYRIRRPRGIMPDRGGEVRIARSSDGLHFDDIWSGTKDQLDSPSIERCALIQLSSHQWAFYVSYVDPKDQRWRIDVVTADRPEEFDLQQAETVLTAAMIQAEGVKDPFVFRLANLYHMVVSFALADQHADSKEMHDSADVYNTGLIRSATGLATSEDGLSWRWQGPVFLPEKGNWDGYCSRLSCLWYQAPVWLGLYDGSADVRENYEERCGLVYSTDLRSWHRVTQRAPLWNSTGALRYFDRIEVRDYQYYYYEMARPDGSHDLRAIRIPIAT